MRFTARSRRAQPWTVTVVNSSGAQVAQGTGTGTRRRLDVGRDRRACRTVHVDDCGPERTLRDGDARRGRRARRAEGAAHRRRRSRPARRRRSSLHADRAATVTAALVAPSGQTSATCFTAPKPAGAQTLTFTPPPGLPNGLYTISDRRDRRDEDGDRDACRFTIDDILTGFSVDRADAELHVHARSDRARVPGAPRRRRRRRRRRSPPAAVGPQTLTWDGTLADGSRAPDGTYTLALTVTDEVATFTRTAAAHARPDGAAITVLSYRNLRFRVSEPATLTLVVGTQRYTRILKKAATTQFWLKTKPAAYRLIATDAAGNTAVVRYRR